MADTSLTLYRKSILRFARSLRIKSSADAIAMNRGIPYKIDDQRPETWPYYMHMAGKYHPTDQMMRVISLDTREEIDFTYDNLLRHRTTYLEYRVGSSYYRELVRKYPDQEDLIQGILNPIATEVSIPAKDFQILYYDTNEVEPQETNLIPELQKRIDRFVDKYYFGRFNLTQDLYPAGFWSVLISQIILMVRNIRKNNVRTEFVHSFYIWAYLGSHQRLNRYKDYLLHDQTMWLYQRVRTLEKHAGKTIIFDELIEKLLTRRTIPITAYEVWHNTENIPQDIFSEIEMAKLPLNRFAIQPFGVEKSTVSEVLEKEIGIAPRNAEIIDEKRAFIPDKAKVLSSNKQTTKVLESEMIDRTDSVPHKLADVLMNHWLYWAATNRYSSMISVTHPANQELLSMSVKEAAIVWIYCLHRMYEIPVINIPTFLATKVARPRIPEFSELRDLATERDVTNNMIHVAMQEYTPVSNIISTEEFYGKASGVYRNLRNHDYMVSTRDTRKRRGYFELVCSRFYQDYRCKFVDDDITYLDWFKLKNWKLDNLSINQYKAMFEEILKLSTGGNLRVVSSVAEVQTAMIRIMRQLSSYSIQFLKKINAVPATVMNFIVARLDEEKIHTKDKVALKVGIEIDTENQFRTHSKHHFDISNISDIRNVKVHSGMNFRLDPTVDFTQRTQIRSIQRMKLPRVYLDVSWSPDINEVMSKHRLDGLKTKPQRATPISEVKPDLNGLNLYRKPKDTRKQMNRLFNTFILGAFELDRHPDHNLVLDAFELDRSPNTNLVLDAFKL